MDTIKFKKIEIKHTNKPDLCVGCYFYSRSEPCFVQKDRDFICTDLINNIEYKWVKA